MTTLLCTLAAAIGLAVCQAGQLSGPVSRVADGDTLRVSGETVRLWGLDAPEKRQECADASGRPYPCGERSRLALEALALGKTATCEVKDRDRYGRVVAACSVGGRDLARQMVEAGLALDYRRYSHGAYAAAEESARLARRGMWSGRFVPPADWRRGAR